MEEEEEEEGEVRAAEAAAMLEKMRRAEEDNDDDDFEKAFRAMMQDSLESASKSTGGSSRAVDVNMARPAVLPKPRNVFTRFSADEEDVEEVAKGVTFKMLSRDARGRIETRQLQLPEETKLATRLAKVEAVKREEKQRLKEKVLQLDSVLAAEQEEGADEMETAGMRQLPPRVVARAPMRGAPRTQQYGATSDLNLSAFLAESHAAEVRRIGAGRSTGDAIKASALSSARSSEKK